MTADYSFLRLPQAGAEPRKVARVLNRILTELGDQQDNSGQVKSTLATTSGTSVTVTDLPAASMFLVILTGVSHNDGGSQNIRVEITDDGGSNWGTPIQITNSEPGSSTVSGTVWIVNCRALGVEKVVAPNTNDNNSSYETIGVESTETGITNGLRFSPSGGNFDAGSIRVVPIY